MNLGFFDQKQCLKNLSKFYKVKLRFENMEDHAHIDLDNEIIYISNYSLERGLEFSLTCFFHELGHLFCKHTGKFKVYHQKIENLSKKQRSIFLKTMWDAEEYVDIFGKKMMKGHFPDLKYLPGYTKSNKKKMYEYMIQEYTAYFNYCDFKKGTK